MPPFAAPIQFSTKTDRTPESPISYFMEQAIENPSLISLAAGLVDSASLPANHITEAVTKLLADSRTAQAALQYGTTQGYTPLRDMVLHHLARLDGISLDDYQFGTKQVVITTGSQQLLYMLGEMLLDPGDIVLTEAPSYFVFHSVLAGTGARVFAVPIDEDGIQVDALAKLFEQLASSGRLSRVKLLYTVDYFQNPTGITLAAHRRKPLMDLLRKVEVEHKQRILVLEDAAYRELRYEGDDIPSLKSLDHDNSRVIYAGTFSKPCSPGLKTGYSVMPAELIEPLIRLKGNHDFGSCNLSQYVLHHLLSTGVYYDHVEYLRNVYRPKRQTMVDTLQEAFRDHPEVKWTKPKGGMFTWFSLPPGLSTGAESPFFKAAIAEGVLYIPGEYGFVGENVSAQKNHARLAFGDAKIELIREGILRLRRALDRAKSIVAPGRLPV